MACVRCRSISSGANAGLRTTSESMSMPTPKLSFMTRTVAAVTSLLAPVSRAPPIESIASAISKADRVVVP